MAPPGGSFDNFIVIGSARFVASSSCLEVNAKRFRIVAGDSIDMPASESLNAKVRLGGNTVITTAIGPTEPNCSLMATGIDTSTSLPGTASVATPFVVKTMPTELAPPELSLKLPPPSANLAKTDFCDDIAASSASSLPTAGLGASVEDIVADGKGFVDVAT